MSFSNNNYGNGVFNNVNGTMTTYSSPTLTPSKNNPFSPNFQGRPLHATASSFEPPTSQNSAGAPPPTEAKSNTFKDEDGAVYWDYWDRVDWFSVKREPDGSIMIIRPQVVVCVSVDGRSTRVIEVPPKDLIDSDSARPKSVPE